MSSSLFSGGIQSQQPSRPIASELKSTRDGPWLHAWRDKVADLDTFSQCLHVSDLNDDGAYSLLVGNLTKKLKVFKGNSLHLMQPLLDTPSGVVDFYSSTASPCIPSVVVAAGASLYIYRNLRPYYKFSLPPLPLNEIEDSTWEKLKSKETDVTDAINTLNKEKAAGTVLTPRSLMLLSIVDQEAQQKFVDLHRLLPLRRMSSITCITTMNKSLPGPRQVSMVVFGAETPSVFFMEPTGTRILKEVKVPDTPMFIATVGEYDVDYRVVVACKNARIYSIRKGKLTGRPIELETLPVSMTVINNEILVACMNSTIHSYHFKGRKNYTLYLPSPIITMTNMIVERTRSSHLLVAALKNGQIRLYSKQKLIHSLETKDDIASILVGPYGREDVSLIYTTKQGTLCIKMLSRSADLVGVGHTTIPVEQDQPLPIPAKTSLFVEQAQREKDQGLDMYRTFQRDLCKVRLDAARAFVKTLTEGHGPVSGTLGGALRIDAAVQGLGPYFKLILTVKNSSARSILDVSLSCSQSNAIYRIDPGVIHIPVLLPSVGYTFDVSVECMDPNGANDDIHVYLSSARSALPIISATVQMPMSELREEE